MYRRVVDEAAWLVLLAALWMTACHAAHPAVSDATPLRPASRTGPRVIPGTPPRIFRAGIQPAGPERAACRDSDELRMRFRIAPTVEVHERVDVRHVAMRLSPAEQEAEFARYGFPIDFTEETGCFMPAYDFSNPELVTDHATGLMWLRRLEGYMGWAEVREHLAAFNREHPAGFSDWRVPTLVELGTLLRSFRWGDTRRFDPRFGLSPIDIWSSDYWEVGGVEERWIYFAREDGISTRVRNASAALLLVRGPIPDAPSPGP